MGSESVSTAWKIDQVGEELSDVWMNAVIVAEELNTTTSDYRIRESRHAITTDPELMASLEEELVLLEKDIEAKFRAYQMLPTRETDQEYIRQAQEVWRDYLECSRNLVETSKGNDREQATELMMGESQELFNKASGLFLQLSLIHILPPLEGKVHFIFVVNPYLSRNLILTREGQEYLRYISGC